MDLIFEVFEYANSTKIYFIALVRENDNLRTKNITGQKIITHGCRNNKYQGYNISNFVLIIPSSNFNTGNISIGKKKWFHFDIGKVLCYNSKQLNSSR